MLMSNTSIRFIQIAHQITAKTAALLCAPVCIVNDEEIIITSTEPSQIGQSLDCNQLTSQENLIRIPLTHNIEMGEIIIGQSYSHEAIPSRLAHAVVELVINQEISQNHLLSQYDLRNQLIHDLLQGCIKDEIITLRQAKQLGVDLTQPRAVILVDALDYIRQNNSSKYQSIEIARKQKTQFLINSIVSFFHLPSNAICADLGEGKVCVLKASNTKNLDPWANSSDAADGLGTSWANLSALKRAADALLLRLRNDTKASINIGIGRYHPGLQGLAQSYEDACAALSLGTRFQGWNRVHCLAELGIAAFVGIANEDTKIDLAKYLLSPLDRDPELLETLDVFFSENCCPSSAAKRLSIHRNTLGYRLDKIASLTGLDPRKFDDAVQMRLSLLLRLLHTESSHSSMRP
jgi:carbohydrate diacid regulator